jgi:hypothetical protein
MKLTESRKASGPNSRAQFDVPAPVPGIFAILQSFPTALLISNHQLG